MKQRFLILDVWISILICLVLLGHCTFPNCPEWYQQLHGRIYAFHMAAFFFVCGFLVCHTYHTLTSWQDYGAYLGRKLKKFGLPFLGFGFLLCGMQILLSHGSWADFGKGLAALFLNPMKSPVMYLWFIYVLFEFYILAPLSCQCLDNDLALAPWLRICIFLLLLVSAACLLRFPLPPVFCLQMFSKFFLFFLLGVAFCRLRTLLKPEWLPYCWVAVPFFILLCVQHPEGGNLWIALLSLPSLAAISALLAKIPGLAKACNYCSKHCFSIYLWQMIAIHLWAKLLLNVLRGPYWVLVVLVVPVGIGGSLLAEKSCHWLKQYLLMAWKSWK